MITLKTTIHIFLASWELLQDASIYILFGILVAGILRVFLNPGSVARHLGQGKFASVFKAAFLGIPIPLCSCGVLPAAVSLKKQGANNGATTAFLISTPESGVDSIALTYALLDPLMTVARPVAAFATAAAAGITENLLRESGQEREIAPDLSCQVDGCCEGTECPPEEHRAHHNFFKKLNGGLKYAFGELWGGLVGWFFVGILLAGVISTLIPPEFMSRHMGGGLSAMLIMLAAAIPLYICATASTPIAAALILQGVSPGAALVFLLAGPATNVTSLTVLLGVLGKRATAIYLASIALFAVVMGLALDQIYSAYGFSAQAMAGQANEILPAWLKVTGAFILILLSVRPVILKLRVWFGRQNKQEGNGICNCSEDRTLPAMKVPSSTWGCNDPSCSN